MKEQKTVEKDTITKKKLKKQIKPFKKRGKKKPLPVKERIAQRRARVMMLVIQGKSQSQIAVITGINIREVRKDFVALRAEVASELRDVDKFDMFAELFVGFRLRCERLWGLVLRPGVQPSVVLGALKGLQAAEDGLWRRCESVGIVPRPLFEGANVTNVQGDVSVKDDRVFNLVWGRDPRELESETASKAVVKKVVEVKKE